MRAIAELDRVRKLKAQSEEDAVTMPRSNVIQFPSQKRWDEVPAHLRIPPSCENCATKACWQHQPCPDGYTGPRHD